MPARPGRQQRPDKHLPPLRSARIALQLSQAELARLASVSLPYLEALERGDGHASAEVRARFALALGIAESALFEEEAGLTATEAAERAGVTIPTVLRAIKLGELCPANAERELPDRESLPDELDPAAIARVAGVSHRAVNGAIGRGALRARQDECGAWRVDTASALAYAAKRKTGKHLIPVEELERWSAERGRTKAEHGKQARRCEHCGTVFERYASAPGSQRYCSSECYWAARRAPLLDAAGACGSPTCQERACPVRPGLCHRPGCDQPAFLATYTRRDIRWVRGHPTVYCSNRCAVLARNAGLRWAEQYEGLKQANGSLDARELGQMLDRAPAVVIGHAQRLGVGARVEGLGRSGAWLFSPGDVETIRLHVESTPWGSHYRDPERRARWYLKRHGNTSMFGKAAVEIAARRGKKVGRPRLAPEKAQSVHKLHAQGRTQRQIARMLRLTRAQVRGVLQVGENPS